jgi:hypothetical protein
MIRGIGIVDDLINLSEFQRRRVAFILYTNDELTSRGRNVSPQLTTAAT